MDFAGKHTQKMPQSLPLTLIFAPDFVLNFLIRCLTCVCSVGTGGPHIDRIVGTCLYSVVLVINEVFGPANKSNVRNNPTLIHPIPLLEIFSFFLIWYYTIK